MMFTSYQFVLFFVVVLAALRAARTDRQRLWVLLVSSGVFYASARLADLPLMLALVLGNYGAGLLLAAKPRKVLLAAVVLLNLLPLLVFKYGEFFAANLAIVVGWLGATWSHQPAAVVLPLGLSFATFVAIAYQVDVFRGRPAERSLLRYGVFALFFPRVVAGPIVRARELMPQLAGTPPARDPWRAVNRIAVGLVKKVLVADFLARQIEPVFLQPSAYDGVANLLAVYLYGFQVYFDFSGYTDIAIGTAALLGYELPENFDRPYLARNISDFWRRWHATLSSWLRDYLFAPMLGRRPSPWRLYVSLMATFVLAGLWHGAAWGFVIWGAIHGALQVGHRLATAGRPVREIADRDRLSANAILWFQAFCLGWIFFRAPSLQTAFAMMHRIGSIPADVGSGSVPWDRVLLALLASPLLLWVYATVSRLREIFVAFRPASGWQAFGYGCSMAAVVTAAATFGAPAAPYIYFAF